MTERCEGRLSELIERYGALLRKAIFRTLPSGTNLDIDDIEQAARIKVWNALTSGRKIRNPSSYLYRVAVNATLDALRQVRARREESLGTVGDDWPTVAGKIAMSPTRQPTPEEDAAANQALDHAERCLGELVPNRRRAVGLHLQGFTSAEIGDLAGWSESKARNLVYRGLADLRACLARKGVEYEAG